jgi:hypothetical protein
VLKLGGLSIMYRTEYITMLTDLVNAPARPDFRSPLNEVFRNPPEYSAPPFSKDGWRDASVAGDRVPFPGQRPNFNRARPPHPTFLTFHITPASLPRNQEEKKARMTAEHLPLSVTQSNIQSDVPTNANEHCVGTESDQAYISA